MSGGSGVFSDDIADRLTSRDLAALTAVYLSDLDPGAVKDDFARAGLVRP